MANVRGVVLVDVDGTVACGRAAPDVCPRPGAQVLIDLLTCLGYEVVLWSAGGAEHARSVAEACGYHGAVRRFLRKPDYPMTEKDALAVVGERPVMQVDDDATERVGDWPFFLIDGWFGDHIAASSDPPISTPHGQP